MPAEVYGFLRDDKATYGEKIVLEHLVNHLPKEYAVYVECAIQDKRQLLFPDFIVSTNYGVVVFEVKDWIEVIRADKFHVRIRTRENTIRKFRNPVNTARNYAISLSNEFKRVSHSASTDFPWGYAAVLPNLPTSAITQLRKAWGHEFVLNLRDLKPDLITKRLRNTLPSHKIRALNKREIDFIRATINPSILIEETKRTVILDPQQEQIVTEPVRKTIKPSTPETSPKKQLDLLDKTSAEPEPKESIEQVQEDEAALGKNTSVRLVRGVAGSGKSLVLVQRARFLASRYPEWNILVLTFNKALRHDLESRLKGFKVRHFHGLCSQLFKGIRRWNPISPDGWLENHKIQYPIIQQFGVEFIASEFEWLKDMRITSLSHYLEVERKGRKKQLNGRQRRSIFQILRAYQAYLDEENAFDWADIPHILIKNIENGKIEFQPYDAILIDEAQDFAPGWIKLVKSILAPENGVVFLSDDPTQSIYRRYSWREKGIHVVGRTRWLRIPYRNTCEIYLAAYQLIASNESLRNSLQEEGILITPDLDHANMRHGPKPLLLHFNRNIDEVNYIREKIFGLLQNGVAPQQIAVLHRRKSGVRQLKEALKGARVSVNTFHAFKGMEFEVVFLTQLQECEVNDILPEDTKNKECRLLYVSMTRAREKLFMSYSGPIPDGLKALDGYVDHIQY